MWRAEGANARFGRVAPKVRFLTINQCPHLALNSCSERKIAGGREATSTEVGHAPV